MIAFLTGRVAGRAPGWALLDVNGVGYRLLMSTASLSGLPADGDEVTVHTYLHVREDELTLYGFESVAERESFERLITVSGVGPKVALAILSTLSPDALATAVAGEDVNVLSTVPGIGKKTAQRICLELKDKLGGGAGSGTGAGSPRSAASDEAVGALLAMGFSAHEVTTAIKGYDGDASNASALVRYALQRLGAAR